MAIKYLSKDGLTHLWEKIKNYIDTKLASKADKTAASTSAAGLMSAADKTKLDGIDAEANKITNNNQLTNGAGYITSSAISGKLNGVTGGSAGPMYYDWRAAPANSESFSAYYYESGASDVTNYRIPKSYCNVWVHKRANSRGTAIAMPWTSNAGRMYIASLHDDGNNNSWGSWFEVYTKKNVEVGGVTITTTAGAAGWTYKTVYYAKSHDTSPVIMFQQFSAHSTEQLMVTNRSTTSFTVAQFHSTAYTFQYDWIAFEI